MADSQPKAMAEEAGKNFIALASHHVDLDYNIYYSANPIARFVYDGMIYNSFAEYQQSSNQDLNSLFGDPQFVGLDSDIR